MDNGILNTRDRIELVELLAKSVLLVYLLVGLNDFYLLLLNRVRNHMLLAVLPLYDIAHSNFRVLNLAGPVRLRFKLLHLFNEVTMLLAALHLLLVSQISVFLRFDLVIWVTLAVLSVNLLVCESQIAGLALELTARCWSIF